MHIYVVHIGGGPRFLCRSDSANYSRLDLNVPLSDHRSARNVRALRLAHETSAVCRKEGS